MAPLCSYQAAYIQMEETKMTDPIDLHVVSWNRPAMTELVIRTIKRNTKPDNYHLIVLDNGSAKPTQEMLKNLHENGLIDELILYDDNLGLEAARDVLLHKFTYGPFFVCIDNDCLPPPVQGIDGQDWLERLYDLMQKYEDFGAISMRTQVMVGTGNIFEEADAAGDEIVEFPHPGGSFRIMRTEAVGRAGGWGEHKPGRGAEERYICGELNKTGWRTAFAVDIRCLHLFGTRGDNPTDRWGYDKDLKPEDTGHSDIAHPALTNGDDLDEIKHYAGSEYAQRYIA